MINRPPLLDLEPDLGSSDSETPLAVRMVRMFFRILLYRTDWLMIIPMAVLLTGQTLSPRDRYRHGSSSQRRA